MNNKTYFNIGNSNNVVLIIIIYYIAIRKYVDGNFQIYKSIKVYKSSSIKDTNSQNIYDFLCSIL